MSAANRRAALRIARTLAELERRVSAHDRSSQAAFRSVMDGTIDVYDGDGELVQAAGLLDDGTVGVVDMVPTVPPAPTVPEVDALNDSLAVTWDGLYVDGELPDGVTIAYVGVHVDQDPDDPDWEPAVESEVAQITEGGGQVVLPADADVPTAVRLVTVTTSGVWSDPTDMVVVTPTAAIDEDQVALIQEELLAPVAPATSPTPVATGLARQILLMVPGVENPTPVTYDYHLGFEENFIPSSATLAISSASTGVGVVQQPDGTDLVKGVRYWARTVARSGDQAAPPSAAVAVELNPLGATDLEVGFLRGYHLAAVLLLASLIRTAETGQRVEIDNNGIRIYNSTGALIVNLSPSEVVVNANRMFVSFLESAGAQLGGTTVGPAGSKFSARSSIIAAPASKLVSVEAVPLARRSLNSGTATPVFTDNTATYWWQVKSDDSGRWYVVYSDPATGQVVGQKLVVSLASSIEGAALTSTALYVARTNSNGTQQIVRRSRSGANGTTFGDAAIGDLPTAPGAGGYAPGEPVLGSVKGSNDILLAHRVRGAQTIGGTTYADNQIMVRRFNPTLNSAGDVVTLSLVKTIKVPIVSSVLRSVGMDAAGGMFDLPAIANHTGLHLSFGQHAVQAVPTAGASVDSVGIAGAGVWGTGNPIGLLWDGAAFWGTETAGDSVVEYGTSSDASDDRWWTYTYVNAAGTQETTMALALKARTLYRHRARLTIPTPPPGVTHARLYESSLDGTTRTRFERLSPGGVSQFAFTSGEPLAVMLDPITSPTSAAANPPPSTSTLSGGSAYVYETADLDTAIYGDGRMTARDALLPTDVVNLRLLQAAIATESAKVKRLADIPIPAGTGGVNVTVTYPTPFPSSTTAWSAQLTPNTPTPTLGRVTSKTNASAVCRFDRSSSASGQTFDLHVGTTTG